MKECRCVLDKKGNITFDNAEFAIAYNLKIKEAENRRVYAPLTLYNERENIYKKIEEMIDKYSDRYNESRYIVSSFIKEVADEVYESYD